MGSRCLSPRSTPEGRDASEGKGPQGGAQERLDRRLEEVAKAVGGGYCRLQMPLSLGPAVRGTVAGHRLGALEGGEGVPPPLPMHPCLRGGGGGRRVPCPAHMADLCRPSPGQTRTCALRVGGGAVAD